MSKIRERKTYMVVEESHKMAYIGHSWAKDLQSILRKCTYGEEPIAAKFFADLKEKQLILVEGVSCPMTQKCANEWVWAYSVRLEELGYRVGNRLGESFEVTYGCKEALRVVQSYSLEDMLHKDNDRVHKCVKSSKDFRTAMQKYGSKDTYCDKMLTIRVPEAVAEAFQTFCKRHGLTQSQGLMRLLAASGDDDAQYLLNQDLEDRLFEADTKIEVLNFENEQLRSRENARNRKAAWHSEAVKLQEQLIRQYRSEFYQTLPQKRNKPIPRFRFSECSKNWKRRQYPSESGVMTVSLDAFIYGLTRGVYFVFARDEFGREWKIRCKEGTNAVGMLMQNVCVNDRWMVACKSCDDGATDLIDALLLPPEECAIRVKTVDDSMRYGKNDGAANWVIEGGNSRALNDNISAARAKNREPWLPEAALKLLAEGRLGESEFYQEYETKENVALADKGKKQDLEAPRHPTLNDQITGAKRRKK